jgi:hypothetical protein
MADRIGTLLNRSGDGGEEVLIVSRGKERTQFRRRDELDWNFRVESADSENIIEQNPKRKPKTNPKPARRASRPRGQRVAYVRVSAADQNEARQLEAVGECDRVYIEKQSARSRADRVKLEECIRYLRDGDELVVASMDRLARLADRACRYRGSGELVPPFRRPGTGPCVKRAGTVGGYSQ